MDFEVRTDGLRSVGRDLDGLGEASGRAVRYSDWTRPQAEAVSASLMLRLFNHIHAVQPAVAGVFDHLQKIAHDSADALFDGANYYDRTDEKAAAAADSELRVMETGRYDGFHGHV